jgi:hypothetical protein
MLILILLPNYRKHVKVRPTATTEMYLEDADIEAAKKEWEELELSEVEE